MTGDSRVCHAFCELSSRQGVVSGAPCVLLPSEAECIIASLGPWLCTRAEIPGCWVTNRAVSSPPTSVLRFIDLIFRWRKMATGNQSGEPEVKQSRPGQLTCSINPLTESQARKDTEMWVAIFLLQRWSGSRTGLSKTAVAGASQDGGPPTPIS